MEYKRICTVQELAVITLHWKHHGSRKAIELEGQRGWMQSEPKITAQGDAFYLVEFPFQLITGRKVVRFVK